MDKGIDNLDELNRQGKQSKNLIDKLPAHHAIILVKNQVGRVNLYKLISRSHIETFANKRPRILKSDYLELSEGLIIGSAVKQVSCIRQFFTEKPAGNSTSC